MILFVVQVGKKTNKQKKTRIESINCSFGFFCVFFFKAEEGNKVCFYNLQRRNTKAQYHFRKQNLIN